MIALHLLSHSMFTLTTQTHAYVQWWHADNERSVPQSTRMTEKYPHILSCTLPVITVKEESRNSLSHSLVNRMGSGRMWSKCFHNCLAWQLSRFHLLRRCIMVLYSSSWMAYRVVWCSAEAHGAVAVGRGKLSCIELAWINVSVICKLISSFRCDRNLVVFKTLKESQSGFTASSLKIFEWNVTTPVSEYLTQFNFTLFYFKTT